MNPERGQQWKWIGAGTSNEWWIRSDEANGAKEIRIAPVTSDLPEISYPLDIFQNEEKWKLLPNSEEE